MSKSNNYRLGKTDKARYGSFEELREAYGLKPVSRRTNDADKLKVQQEKFLGTCKCCKQPMALVKNSNVLVCSNESCRGFKHTAVNEDGTTREWYTPYSRILDEKGLSISMNLFD